MSERKTVPEYWKSHIILTGHNDAHKPLRVNSERTCKCDSSHINCLSAKEWLKRQLGVWEFYYEKRDIRDKSIHPATFPISLATEVIELFTHEGQLVMDPFVGSGTTLLSAQDANRSAIGFDLQKKYVELASERLQQKDDPGESLQVAIEDDARNIPEYIDENSVSLIFTSPPYANLLNRKRSNKSRRYRDNDQLGRIEQYSQDKRDLGTLDIKNYSREIGTIFENLLPLLKQKAHCVINVADMWWQNTRIPIHSALINEMTLRGYELRNIIIWDRRNIVNRMGIFGWPNNYITMGVTFEYLLDFWKPPEPVE